MSLPGIPKTFGLVLSRRPFNWADVIVLLALVGLLATVAGLGHDLWAPFTPEVAPEIELSPWRLPYYAARSLLRMFAALGASRAFALVVASWAAKSPAAARVILPALDILQSVPVLGFLSATLTFFLALTPGHILGLELLLPGIGSFMAVAVKAADGRALAWAVKFKPELFIEPAE